MRICHTHHLWKSTRVQPLQTQSQKSQDVFSKCCFIMRHSQDCRHPNTTLLQIHSVGTHAECWYCLPEISRTSLKKTLWRVDGSTCCSTSWMYLFIMVPSQMCTLHKQHMPPVHLWNAPGAVFFKAFLNFSGLLLFTFLKGVEASYSEWMYILTQNSLSF